MEARVGTSGYAYDVWKGGFYPSDIKSDDMLAFYAERFTTVEINNTFYRIPKRDVVQRWADVTPDTFQFVIKASRRITHLGRLGDVKDTVDYMVQQLAPLGPRCGPVLFQCPPGMRKDVERLRRFLSWLPETMLPAMEFRHVSWADDAVYELLRERNAAWVITDDAAEQPPLVATAPWAFVRLRAGTYSDAVRQWWATEMPKLWSSAYVFLKHEDSAPELAYEFRAALAGSQEATS